MMKYLCFLFFCLLLFHVQADAQEISGKVVYSEVVNLEKMMRDNDRPMTRRFEMPKERTSTMVLYLDGEETLYTKYEDPEAEEDVYEHGGRRFMFRMHRDEGKVYRNLGDSSFIEERNLLDKKFLIQGPPKAIEWKMTPDQMQVGSYLCLKATADDTSGTIIAWFTPQIPVSAGPSYFGGLPGLILHVDINGGERTLTATEIDLDGVEEGVIEKPGKGKAVSREEFEEIVRQKREEMQEMQGGDRRHIIFH